MLTNEQKKAEIEKVLEELRKAGIKVSTGNVKVSNKPKINSGNGG